ncbi:hypothetical protein [Burkholderia arboris]|uniref:hypothetical protein n=1 Tax=Burkholderia arboris TaxID=488730 RepID=UPI00210DD504|nr:hypothetical protein [Burkholderia arboris]UTV58885.1 hypothetical protein NLX30_22365 [Burkholderia arboris]
MARLTQDAPEVLSFDLTVDGTLVSIVTWMGRIWKNTQLVVLLARDSRQPPCLGIQSAGTADKIPLPITALATMKIAASRRGLKSDRRVR